MTFFPCKRPPIFLEDGTIQIVLTQGYVALIDAEDAHLAAWGWYAMVGDLGHVYAVTRDENGRTVYLHREIFGLGKGHAQEVDHKFGNTLDCRRSEMRVVAPIYNRRNRKVQANNTSGMPGVGWSKKELMWLVRIGKKHVGTFRLLEDAKAARLKAERELWGIEPRRAAAHGETA